MHALKGSQEVFVLDVVTRVPMPAHVQRQVLEDERSNSTSVQQMVGPASSAPVSMHAVVVLGAAAPVPVPVGAHADAGAR